MAKKVFLLYLQKLIVGGTTLKTVFVMQRRIVAKSHYLIGLVLFTTTALCFNAQASIGENSWGLKSAKKHIEFETGKSIGQLEEEVFMGGYDFQKKWKLVHEIAKNKSEKEAVSFLKKCARSKEWYLQSSALYNLKNIDPKAALSEAKRLLRVANALVVRSTAVSIIEEVGSHVDIEFLWDALNKKENFRGRESLWIRPQIAKSILKIQDNIVENKGRWKNLLTDSNKEVRAVAKKALLIK